MLSEPLTWPSSFQPYSDPAYSIAVATCDRWAEDPQRRALLEWSSNGSTWWTFAQIRDASMRLANALIAHNVSFGSRVIVLLPQGAEAAIAHLAIYRIGAIAVPVSEMHGTEAISQRLGDSGAVLAITSHSQWARLIEGSELERAVTWMLSTDETVPTGTISFSEAVSKGSISPIDAPITANTPAMIVYTSGTTGNPKGVVHAHRVVASHVTPIHLVHNGFPADGDLLWSPADWAWAGGLIDCLLSAWHAGVPIVAYRDRRFEPDRVLDMMTRAGVRNTFMPATALRLIRDADVPRESVPSLRSIMTGGEPVGQDIVDWSEDFLGVLPNVVFGQTEASAIVGNSFDIIPPRTGALGIPFPGCTIAVLDENGNELGAGVTGELSIRADASAIMLGYWNRPEATAEKIVDGWLRTGDLGKRDDEGYLWFVSRGDDLILSSGYRIGPGEIEECLSGDPRVREVAVVGEPDAERGEIVRAVVALREGVVVDDELIQELKSRVRSQLASYEVPRVIDFVDALPRTTTGKIQRGALKAHSTPHERTS